MQATRGGHFCLKRKGCYVMKLLTHPVTLTLFYSIFLQVITLILLKHTNLLVLKCILCVVLEQNIDIWRKFQNSTPHVFNMTPPFRV